MKTIPFLQYRFYDNDVYVAFRYFEAKKKLAKPAKKRDARWARGALYVTSPFCKDTESLKLQVLLIQSQRTVR